MKVHANSLRNTLRILRESRVAAVEFHPDGALRSVQFAPSAPETRRDARPAPQRRSSAVIDVLREFGHDDSEAIAVARDLELT